MSKKEIMELRDLVLILWGYAQIQGIERQAGDGDHHARAVVSLTQSEISSWRYENS